MFDSPKELIPFAGILMVLLIVLTSILTSHQRKMAAFLHGRRDENSDARLLHEIAELRQVVAQQAIALDNLTESHRKLLAAAPKSESVRERLSAG